MNTKMDRSRLNIGAYILQDYARTEQHIKDVADCGIDFIVCMENDRKALDLFAKYNVGAIVTGILPGWWGGDGDRAGTMHKVNPFELYEKAAAEYVDHPAIWGIDTGDEPSALDFPYYGKVMAFTEQKFPNQFAYLNLYPNYASVSENNAEQTVNQLGTPTYAQHIEEYCKHIGADYICYDFYLYSTTVAGAYENLRTVADACLRTGRSMWIVLQVNSKDPAKWISLNQLRFQAYTAMAFGAENIIWACYTAGWWANQVVDENGEKTEQYAKLQAMNAELRAMGDAYMRFRRVSTHFLGFDANSADLNGVAQAPIAELNTGVFQQVRGENLVVGEMVSRKNDGATALMLAAADDPQDVAPKQTAVSFRAYERKISLVTPQGTTALTPDADGVYHIELCSNAGALVIAEL